MMAVDVTVSCCPFPPAASLENAWQVVRPALFKLVKQVTTIQVRQQLILTQVHVGARGLVVDEQGNPLKGSLVRVNDRTPSGVPFC